MDRLRFIVSCFIVVLQVNTVFPKVIKVGKDHPIKSINEAINMACAGDVIEVASGIYKENIVITKPIKLRGIDFPSIDASLNENVVLVTSDNVAIEGFRIENSGRSSLNEYCGIKVEESRKVVIRNNKIINNSIGINLKKSNTCEVYNNYVTTSITDMPVLGNAIHCWNCDSLSIKNNVVGKHRDGIYLEFVKDSDIDDNRVENCKRYGLHFMFSHRDNYRHNVFRHNGAGVAVMYTRQVVMENNLFEYNISDISYGLLLKDISESTIVNNKFIKNSIGIYMDGTNKVEVKRNVFNENGLGIRIVASSDNNVLSENDFTGNTFDVGTNGRSLNNKFERNYWDKYRGYDLDKDGFGDVPHHPLSLFSMISEYNPMAMLFFHSIVANLLDISERIVPTVTPDNFVDARPVMKRMIND